MLVNLKKPNSHQPVFRPEVLPAPSTRKQPVWEAKFNLKNYTGWNANSYIITQDMPFVGGVLPLCSGYNVFCVSDPPPPLHSHYSLVHSELE